MAKEIIVHVWCDVCMEDGERTPSQSYTVTLDRGKPLTLDLCEPHHVTLLAPLRSALSKHGKKEEAEEPPSGKSAVRDKPIKARSTHYPCLLCGDSSTTQYSFAKHLFLVHALNPHQLYGTACPVCGANFAAATALGSHLSRAHSNMGLSTAEIFFAVREKDPHGIIADRLQALAAPTKKGKKK